MRHVEGDYMKTHDDYTRDSPDALEVTALIHCGQYRDLSVRRGVDKTTRMYRVEPHTHGFIFIENDTINGGWKVWSTLGTDVGYHPLVSEGEIQEIVSQARNWKQMEVCLASYFCCGIFEFHEKSPEKRRLKTRCPDLDDG